MKKNDRQANQENIFQLIGWLLFVVCALFYIFSGLRNQDYLTLAGSIIFLVACIVFLIPVLRSLKGK